MNTAVDPVVAATRAWLERAVIGLNLCPFAKAVHVKGQIHYAVSSAAAGSGVLADLGREVDALVALSPSQRETTLLVVPQAFADFLEFNEFLDRADRLVRKRGLEGVVQIASFHPGYRFADSEPEDLANYTNRAPYPTLHLLREASIERAVQSIADPTAIYEANMAALRRLGRAGWDALGVGPAQ